MKVQIGKLAKILECRSIVGFGCFNFAIKAAEHDFLSVRVYPCHPSTLEGSFVLCSTRTPKHPKVLAGRIVCGRAVAGVLGVCGKPEIIKTIVAAIAVFVVNLLHRPLAIVHCPNNSVRQKLAGLSENNNRPPAVSVPVVRSESCVSGIRTVPSIGLPFGGSSARCEHFGGARTPCEQSGIRVILKDCPKIFGVWKCFPHVHLTFHRLLSRIRGEHVHLQPSLPEALL